MMDQDGNVLSQEEKVELVEYAARDLEANGFYLETPESIRRRLEEQGYEISLLEVQSVLVK